MGVCTTTKGVEKVKYPCLKHTGDINKWCIIKSYNGCLHYQWYCRKSKVPCLRHIGHINKWYIMDVCKWPPSYTAALCGCDIKQHSIISYLLLNCSHIYHCFLKYSLLPWAFWFCLLDSWHSMVVHKCPSPTPVMVISSV